MLGKLPDWMVLRADDGVVEVSEDAGLVRRTLCADVDEDRFLRDLYPGYVGLSLRSLADASSAPAAGHETTYVICEQDQALPPAAQEAMATSSDHVERLPSSHSPMLSMPGRLAQVLDGAAARA
jgi:hypothetical protein